MGKLGLNSGYVGSDQRTSAVGAVGYDKYYLERRAGRFQPIIDTGNDPNAIEFFLRVTAAGGTLTSTEQSAVDILVKQLKFYNLWSPMKVIYPMVGASAEACAQNLKSSSFTGTFSAGMYYSSTGVTPNGTSAYMDTGYNPRTHGLQNSAHMSYYSRTNIVGGQVDMGIQDAISHYLLFNYNNLGYCAINSAENPSLSLPPTTLGLKIGTRNTSTTEEYNVNNVYQQISRNSGIAPSKNIFLFCYNANGPLLFSSKECAFASIGDGLSSTDMTNLNTVIQTFQTTLGRQV
jgi:hypothetical protein